MYLNDGTFIPSFLGISSNANYSSDMFANTVLRAGEVKETLYTDDPRNVNKRFIEYSVEVQYRRGSGPSATIVYQNCILVNPMGGLADVFTFTLRQPDGTVDKNKLTNGSQVLLLCVNGDNHRAVILGGLRHRDDTDSKEDGHNLRFEFNGIEAKVNKDGELIVTRKSATDNNGNPQDPSNAQAQISFNKDGTIVLGYADSEGDKPKITWDKNADTITIHGTTKVRIEANGGPVEIETSSGVKINDATEAFVRGTTYRQKQAELHSKLIELLDVLSTQHKAAGAGMAYLAAGPVITSMAQTFDAMKSAIKSFEQEADEYLSKKHFHED